MISISKAIPMTAKKLLMTLELWATPDDVLAIIKVKILHI